jgi:hypothetical protein
MKIPVLAICVIALCGPQQAAALSSADCAGIVPQVNGDVAAPDLNVARLIREGDPEVAAAARRLEALRSQGAQPDAAALINATRDLRYQLQVCARR